MDYVVASTTVRDSATSGPVRLRPVVAAIAHSTVAARFGTGTNFVTIYRVRPDGPVHAPWWLPGYGSMQPPTTGPARGERL